MMDNMMAGKKADRLAASKKQTEDLLKKVGYTGKSGPVRRVLDYSTPVPGLAECSNTMTYTPHSRVRKKYTGDEIIGIAVMHKSNAVPIRSKKTAEEVAKMRRG